MNEADSAVLETLGMTDGYSLRLLNMDGVVEEDDDQSTDESSDDEEEDEEESGGGMKDEC